MVEHTAEDLRTAIDRLSLHDELAEVKGEVHWDRELGAVTREVLRRNGPALLFENITGYNGPGSRCGKLVTSLLASTKRLALLLGYDAPPGHDELVRHVLEKNAERIPPVVVDDGPVHEQVVVGDDVDLGELPVPQWHHLDGGRYINTFAAIVTKDPEDGSVNLGVYRGMVSGRNNIPMLLVPSQHWGLHWAKHLDRGRPMEVACVYGWHPVMDFIAGSPIPKGVSEYDVMARTSAGRCHW